MRTPKSKANQMMEDVTDILRKNGVYVTDNSDVAVEIVEKMITEIINSSGALEEGFWRNVEKELKYHQIAEKWQG